MARPWLRRWLKKARPLSGSARKQFGGNRALQRNDACCGFCAGSGVCVHHASFTV